MDEKIKNDDTIDSEEEVQFEQLINGLIENEYGLCDHFLENDAVGGLRQCLLDHKSKGEMHSAGIGRKFDFQTNAEVRGDEIKWIELDSANKFEKQYNEKMQRLIRYLNLTCYTSLNSFENHYANYEVNSFYKRHLDQFQKEKGRKYSVVLYLNDNWLDVDGGLLSLYFDNKEKVDIAPIAGRLVFFKSDQIEHEVHASSTRNRMSVAGWMKSI